MTNSTKPADDAALIALVTCLLENEPDDLIADGGITVLDQWRKDAARLIGWQPPAALEPDRAEVLWSEMDGPQAKGLAAIRRHFDELRAEWEAERPVIDVPDDIRKMCFHIHGGYGHGAYAERLAYFILSLTNGAGVRAMTENG